MEAEPQGADVSVKVEKAGAGDMWKAAATLGVGAAIGLFLVPWMTRRADRDQEFIQTTVKDNTVALTKVEAALQTQVVATNAQAGQAAAQTAAIQQQTAALATATQAQTEAIKGLGQDIQDLTKASQGAKSSTEKLTSSLKDKAQEEPSP